MHFTNIHIYLPLQCVHVSEQYYFSQSEYIFITLSNVLDVLSEGPDVLFYSLGNACVFY